MEEREIIRDSLEAKKMLVTLNDEELLKVAEDDKKFSSFIRGVAVRMNSAYVCYAFQFNSILRKMINEASKRDLSENDLNCIYKVLYHLDEYGSQSKSFRYDFTSQYEYIETNDLGLAKLGLTLEDLDRNLLGMFDKINSGNIEDVKTDKYYLATVSYLSKIHPRYLRNSFMIPEIKKSLCFIDKNSFDDRKEYRAFKRVASRTMRRIEKSYKLEQNNSQKKMNK